MSITLHLGKETMTPKKVTCQTQDQKLVTELGLIQVLLFSSIDFLSKAERVTHTETSHSSIWKATRKPPLWLQVNTTKHTGTVQFQGSCTFTGTYHLTLIFITFIF